MYYIDTQECYMKLNPYGFFTNEKAQAESLMFRPKNNIYHESQLINWCTNIFIKEDKNFIDIGGHIGSWTMVCGAKAKHTYTFECNKKVYNCLCANLFLKGLSYKVDAYNCGLSNENGTKVYYKRSKDGGGNGVSFLRESDKDVETDNIQVKKLDEYNLENINFLKIDVEGHEKEVLQGAVKTLEDNDYPTFIFESWASWRDDEGSCPAIKLRKELFEYIRSLEYKILPIRGWEEIFLAERNK